MNQSEFELFSHVAKEKGGKNSFALSTIAIDFNLRERNSAANYIFSFLVFQGAGNPLTFQNHFLTYCIKLLNG